MIPVYRSSRPFVQKFLREHRSGFDDVTGRTRLVAVQMPPAPSERDLYEEL
jgi:hypothetical protein